MPHGIASNQPRRRPGESHNRPVRANTPPRKRVSDEEIQLRVAGAVVSAFQNEEQTLLQPPELPRQRRSPRRTGSAAGREPGVVPAHTPSMTISGAAARGPVTVPAAYLGGEHKVDKVSKLFTSLETMQEVRQTALRRIFGHIIHPQSPRKRVWDLFVLLLVIFSTLYESYNAAFRPMHTVTLWWELVIDL
eukprot:COSAG02_NODE_1997_length_10152_cov_3.110315_4_plen_191_part_00